MNEIRLLEYRIDSLNEKIKLLELKVKELREDIDHAKYIN
jgi:peptidoglycan hydrolase CwlO-like protein